MGRRRKKLTPGKKNVGGSYRVSLFSRRRYLGNGKVKTETAKNGRPRTPEERLLAAQSISDKAAGLTEKDTVMIIKKIELEVCFDDNFFPPEKFDEPTKAKHWKSQCEGCPFYGWDDEYADGWCNVTAVRDVAEECPIRKFFN